MAYARKKGKGYEIRVCYGHDGNGRKLEKSRTWVPVPGMKPKQIEKELERQKLLFEDELLKGSLISGDVRFSDFSERWMTEYAKVKLAPKTVERYRDFLKRINPTIG